jgi:ABC-type uncharacterized transport system substrate-binding protein
MRRRELIAAIGGAALFGSLAPAGARQSKQQLIATLSQGSEGSGELLLQTFRQALAALGYDDDKIDIESRWANGSADRLPALAAELVRLGPAVIVASSGTAARALKNATATIPIVMAVSDDPVGSGLIESMAHPGGNLTGFSFAQEDTVGRELQLLTTMAPNTRRVAVFANPKSRSSGPIVRALHTAAVSLQIEAMLAEAATPAEIAPAFERARTERADAILVLGDGLYTSERRRLIELAARGRLPAIYHDHIFVEDGGLMSYGGDLGDNYRRTAAFVDKILRGAKPADLPVEEPTKFYLFINRRTASALGLGIPPILEAQADRIIE